MRWRRLGKRRRPHRGTSRLGLVGRHAVEAVYLAVPPQPGCGLARTMSQEHEGAVQELFRGQPRALSATSAATFSGPPADHDYLQECVGPVGTVVCRRTRSARSAVSVAEDKANVPAAARPVATRPADRSLIGPTWRSVAW